MGRRNKSDDDDWLWYPVPMPKPPRPPKPATKPVKTQRPPPGLPDRDTLIKYLRTAGEQDKGDIARAFGLKGEGRRALQWTFSTGARRTAWSAGSSPWWRDGPSRPREIRPVPNGGST